MVGSYDHSSLTVKPIGSPDRIFKHHSANGCRILPTPNHHIMASCPLEELVYSREIMGSMHQRGARRRQAARKL